MNDDREPNETGPEPEAEPTLKKKPFRFQPGNQYGRKTDPLKNYRAKRSRKARAIYNRLVEEAGGEDKITEVQRQLFWASAQSGAALATTRNPQQIASLANTISKLATAEVVGTPAKAGDIKHADGWPFPLRPDEWIKHDNAKQERLAKQFRELIADELPSSPDYNPDPAQAARRLRAIEWLETATPEERQEHERLKAELDEKLRKLCGGRNPQENTLATEEKVHG